MTGTGPVFQIGVIYGAGIFIADYGCNRCAAGKAVQNAAQKFRSVLFPAGSGPVILPRSPAIQKGLKLFWIHREAGRDPVQGHADGRTVRRAENG